MAILLSTIVGILVVGIIVGAVYGWWWVYRSALPVLNGTLFAPDLHHPVTVGRDAEGIPHVTATTLHDGAFAMGYLHGQDRLWQLELSRRIAAGRLSEFAGAPTIEADRFLRRVGLRRLAEEEWSGTKGEARAMVEAYAKGVNAARNDSKRLPLEFRLLNMNPEPWSAVDSLSIFKLLGLSLSLNWDVEKQRLMILEALGPEKAALLDPLYPDANPTILAATLGELGGAKLQKTIATFHEAEQWLRFGKGGSNSWVISGSKTESGRPLLCNDPHLLPSVPSPWYAAHIHITDDFSSTGVSFPGMPFIMIGHNTDVAWGYTNSFADAQDLVVEEFDGPAYRRYRTEKGARASKLIREIIRVKDQSDVIEDVTITRHGPIVDRLDTPDRGVWKGLALQWTANPPGKNAEAMLKIQRATDWKTFREAHSTFDAPSQNVIYADIKGHIGYFTCGRVPVRKRIPSGLPIPGWTGTALWERYLSIDEVPQIFDPPEGILITANNRIVGDAFPQYIGNDYMNGYRAKRIADLLEAQHLNAELMRNIQMDILALPALAAISLLRTVTATGEAEVIRNSLIAWDGTMDPALSEPFVFEVFMRRLSEHALRPLCGDAWSIVDGSSLTHPVFGYPGNTIGRFTPFLLQHWADRDDVWFDGATSWETVVVKALTDTATDLPKERKRSKSKKWGMAHQMTLAHPLAQIRPLKWIFNIGPIPMTGSIDTVHASAFNPSEPYATTMWAPSWREILDVGNWDGSTGIYYPGQSGQPGSKFYRNLVHKWQKNEQLPLSWTEHAVQSSIRTTLILTPNTSQ